MADDLIPSATEAVATFTSPVRPSMRGQLHVGAAFTSVATGVVLVAVAASLTTRAAGWSTVVYAIAILSLFTVSGLYHRRDWSPRGRAVMKRLDHSMIFVLIAGTYTPISVLTLTRPTAEIVLGIVWSGTVAGVLLNMVWTNSPRWMGVSLYIALGWTAAAVFPAILHGGGVAAFVLIVAGGLAYTVGALAYATKRPDPAPATFGFHEVFHACTLVAATCHYIAIWLIVF